MTIQIFEIELMYIGDCSPVTLRLLRYECYQCLALVFADSKQNVVLSEKPPITSTIHTLPPSLLDTLLAELSTLASVYHKPPETFLGQGRFGAEAMQKAAIE